MVDKRDCSFCGRPIEPGTGKMFVKKDGTRFHFDSHKCQTNMLVLKRVPRKVKWTTHYERGLPSPTGATQVEVSPGPATPTAAGGAARPAEQKSPAPEPEAEHVEAEEEAPAEAEAEPEGEAEAEEEAPAEKSA